MIELILVAVVCVAVGAVGLVVLDRLIRRPSLAAGLVILAVVLDMALPAGVAVRAGTIKISLLDAVFLLTATAGVCRHMLLRNRSAPHVLLYALCMLAVFSVARGLPTYGEAAAREFRPYLAFLGGALYFSSVPFDLKTRSAVGRAVLAGAVGTAAVVLVRWAANLAHLDLGPLAAEFSHAIRVLNGPQTYFLGEAFLISLSAIGARQDVRFQRALIGVFLAMTVLLNRRTMWAALIAGLVILALRDRDWARRLGALLPVVFVVGAATFLLLPDEAPDGEQVVAESATSTGTLEWRIEGWKDLLEGWSPTDLDGLAGERFGSGFERQVVDRVLTSNPHSFYVETLLRLGVVGLVSLVALYAVTIRRLLRRNRFEVPGLLARPVVLGLLVAHVVWLFTWPPGAEQGMLIGLTVAAATARRASPSMTAVGQPVAAARLPRSVAAARRERAGVTDPDRDDTQGTSLRTGPEATRFRKPVLRLRSAP